VGNQQHREAVIAQATHDVQQGGHFVRRQNACRLIEDKDAGVASQRLEDFDALLLADREVAHVSRRGDIEAVARREAGYAFREAANVEADALRLSEQRDVLQDG